MTYFSTSAKKLQWKPHRTEQWIENEYMMVCMKCVSYVCQMIHAVQHVKHTIKIIYCLVFTCFMKTINMHNDVVLYQQAGMQCYAYHLYTKKWVKIQATICYFFASWVKRRVCSKALTKRRVANDRECKERRRIFKITGGSQGGGGHCAWYQRVMLNGRSHWAGWTHHDSYRATASPDTQVTESSVYRLRIKKVCLWLYCNDWLCNCEGWIQGGVLEGHGVHIRYLILHFVFQCGTLVTWARALSPGVVLPPNGATRFVSDALNLKGEVPVPIAATIWEMSYGYITMCNKDSC